MQFKIWRKKMGFTQKDVAHDMRQRGIPCSQSTLSKFESLKLSPYCQYKLKTFLQIWLGGMQRRLNIAAGPQDGPTAALLLTQATL